MKKIILSIVLFISVLTQGQEHIVVQKSWTQADSIQNVINGWALFSTGVGKKPAFGNFKDSVSILINDSSVRIKDTIGGVYKLGTNTQIGTNYSTAILGGNTLLHGFTIGLIDTGKINIISNGYNMMKIEYLPAGKVGNAFLGFQAGQNVIPSYNLSEFNGCDNTAVGWECMVGGIGSTARDNTAIGITCLNGITSGVYNCLGGCATGKLITTGSANNGMADHGLYSATTASYNTIGGYTALYNLVKGDYNTAIGYNVMYDAVATNFCVAIGNGALYNDTASSNVGVGSAALYHNIGGAGNVAVGANAATLNVSSNFITAIGFDALNHSTGSSNTACGSEAALQTTTGKNNTSIGAFALNTNVTGSSNTASGQDALFSNLGDYNCGFGNRAGTSNTTGIGNLFLGDSAGYGSTTASHSIYIGYMAGRGTNISHTFWIDTSVTTLQGGSAVWVTPAGQLRDTIFKNKLTQNVTVATANQNITMTSGYNKVILIVTISGVGTVGVITLPNSPKDGDEVAISSSATLSLVLGSNFAPTPVLISNLTATSGTFDLLEYDAGTSTWNQIN